MISYADIEEIYRLECKEPTLQKIEEDFYLKFLDNLELIEEKHRAYILKILGKIYEERERKILFHALRSQKGEVEKPINIIKNEEKLYYDVIGILRDNREKNFSATRSEEKPFFKMLEIIFIKPIPAFICSDLKRYGPFKEGDTAKIVEENARILVERGFAVIQN